MTIIKQNQYGFFNDVSLVFLQKSDDFTPP